MTELQTKLLEIFKWFHSFCEKHELRYYALGGTMLGAMRHKGFIPWDDDIDVGMPREDYDKFEKLIKETGSYKKYILETPNTLEKDYFYPFSKIYDSETTLIENTGIKIKRGIYIDVFPLDGIGNSLEESKKNYKTIYWKYNLLLTRVAGIREGRHWLKNAAVVIARCIPNTILNNKKLLKKVVENCKKLSFDECTWCGNLMGAWRFKEVMPVEIFGEPTVYDFEGIKIYGAQKADEYLSYLYGEWKMLPPKEKQVTHHDFIECDLHKSYLEIDA